MRWLALLASAVLAACSAPAAQREVLRVGTSGDYPPFSVRAADGSLDGFDVAVARALARDRGARLEVATFAWPDLERRLLEGEFDVAMSGVTVRGDRLARAPMTAAVARAAAVLVARADHAVPAAAAGDGRGLTVAVNRGGHLERVARSALPGATLVTVDDNRSLPAVLRSGEVDAVVTDSLEVRSFAGSGAPARVVRVLAQDRKAYWVSPRAADLAPQIDAWLALREADGTLDGLRARHLGPDADPAASGLEPASARAADLVARRLLLMPEVAAAKGVAGLPVDVPAREAVVYARAREAAARDGLEPETYEPLVRAQVEAAKAVQHAVLAAAPAPQVPPDEPMRRNATARLEGELRPAIDAIDAALRAELARSAPLPGTTAALADALRRDAPVPGLDAALARRLASALQGVRPQISLERPEPTS